VKVNVVLVVFLFPHVIVSDPVFAVMFSVDFAVPVPPVTLEVQPVSFAVLVVVPVALEPVQVTVGPLAPATPVVSLPCQASRLPAFPQ
jgi:hypothetical protein